MTTAGAGTTAEIGSPGGPPTTDLPGGDPALRTGRGRTTIAPRVAEKIARRAAAQTAGVCDVASGGLDRFLPWVQGGSAAADVDLGTDDDSVAVELTIGVSYPEPVVEVARHVREQVVERLTTDAGLRVTSVDILVASLVPERPVARRVR